MVKTSQRSKTCRIFRRVGNTEALGFQLTNIDGDALDLTGLTLTISGYDLDTSSAAFSDAAVTINDVTTGKCSWVPEAADVAEVRDIALVVQDNQGRQYPYDGARTILEVRDAYDGQFG